MKYMYCNDKEKIENGFKMINFGHLHYHISTEVTQYIQSIYSNITPGYSNMCQGVLRKQKEEPS